MGSHVQRFVLAAAFVGLALVTSAAVARQTVDNYFEQPAAGGSDNILNLNGTWRIDGTAVTATAAELNTTGTVTNAVDGVAAGYIVARGTVTLDGSNPSSATTGLSAIVACTVSNKRSDAPGDDPVAFTIATAAVAGRLDVYAWKHDGTDPTLVASTDSDDTIDWICVGT